MTDGNEVRQEIEKRLEDWREPLYEAGASWTVRYFDAAGFDCMLTLRAHDGSELMPKVLAATEWLVEHGARPISCNGNGSSGSSGRPAAAGQAQGQGGEAWCAVHDCQMRRREKDGQVWFSHKAPDGSWCRGK